MRQIIAQDVPPPPPGLFSNAVECDGIIYVSGMHAGGAGAVPSDPQAQARIALQRVIALVEAAGSDRSRITRMTFYVTDIAYKDALGQARRDALGGAPLPAATLVAVTGFVDPALKVEIDATAHMPR